MQRIEGRLFGWLSEANPTIVGDRRGVEFIADDFERDFHAGGKALLLVFDPGEMQREEIQKLIRLEEYSFRALERNAALTVALELLEADPHPFSTRPCPTCRPVSVLLGRPYGCSAKAAKAARTEGCRSGD